MRYPAINHAFFSENRNRFAARMLPSSVAVFHSNEQYPRNGDQFLPFRQQSDLFYLTGIEQEKTISEACVLTHFVSQMFNSFQWPRRTDLM